MSFLTELFSAKPKDEAPIILPPPTTVISQNSINLLNAPTNSNVVAGRGGAALSLVQNSALIPVVGPLGSTADIDNFKNDSIFTYTVRDGDTLSSVAKTFGVSVNTIVWANNIKRNVSLKPGDTLVILPVSGVKHAVQSGDTLEIIAKKYNGNLDEILAFNDLSVTTILQPGDEVIIPDGEIASPAPVVVSAPASPKKTTPTVLGRASGSLPSVAGYFKNPLPTGVRTQGLHGYNGVDLGAPCGDNVYAAAAGTVLIARNDGAWNGGYGNYVVIAHPNGTQTLYAHESVVYARVGSYVQQGDVIGLVGSTGRSTGCHVHFEVRGAKNPF